MKFFRLRLRRTRRVGGLLAAFGALVTTLVVTGTAAMAQVLPPSSGSGDVTQPAPPAPLAGGMPGWQITLIAVGAALVAAVLAVLADRAWSTRGRLAGGPTRAWEA
jgi:hypothetical protein